MCHLDRMIAYLRKRKESVPKPLTLPTEAEITAAEQETGVAFHPSFRQLLLSAGDVAFSTIELVNVTYPDSHSYFPRVLSSARRWGMPNDLIPICENSDGDYFCMKANGGLEYWSHNDETDEAWPDLATWIEQVWIGEALDDDDNGKGKPIALVDLPTNEEGFPEDNTVGSHRQKNGT